MERETYLELRRFRGSLKGSLNLVVGGRLLDADNEIDDGDVLDGDTERQSADKDIPLVPQVAWISLKK